MNKRFIITESEVTEIRALYGLINEQAKVINASTDPQRMTNFSPNGNQKFGLKGDASKENFYFKTTLGKLVTASTGETSAYFSSFEPTTDAKKYVDYVKVGENELINSGSITFDLSKLSETTEVTATHNGLLVLRRMMNELGGQKKGKVTLTMSAEVRESGQKSYDVAGIPGRLQAIFNSLQTALAVLIVPEKDRSKIGDEYAKKYFLGKNDDGIKASAEMIIKSALISVFLAKEDTADKDKIITEKKLVTTVDLNTFASYYGKGLTTTALDKPWADLQNEIKKVMVSNFKLYLPEEFQYLADNTTTLVANTYSSVFFKKGYDSLFKESKLAPGSPNQQATKTQSSTSYEVGK